MVPWGVVCEDVEQISVLGWGGPALLPRPTQGTSRAETRHRLLTKNFTASNKFWDPGVLRARFWSKIVCLEAPGRCPGFLTPGPLPAGALSISTHYWLQMLRQGPSVLICWKWLMPRQLVQDLLPHKPSLFCAPVLLL
jgi:hypothetical protein